MREEEGRSSESKREGERFECGGTRERTFGLTNEVALLFVLVIRFVRLCLCPFPKGREGAFS